jgi:hypothetical protein
MADDNKATGNVTVSQKDVRVIDVCSIIHTDLY